MEMQESDGAAGVYLLFMLMFRFIHLLIFLCFSMADGKRWESDPLVAVLGVTAPLSSTNKYQKRLFYLEA